MNPSLAEQRPSVLLNEHVYNISNEVFGKLYSLYQHTSTICEYTPYYKISKHIMCISDFKRLFMFNLYNKIINPNRSRTRLADGLDPLHANASAHTVMKKFVLFRCQ